MDDIVFGAPAALRQLAQLVDRAREDVVATRTHLEKMQDFAGGEGVIGRLTGGHRDAYQALDEWLGKLADNTLASVARAVTESAAYYEHTDHASAERLDDAYPAADAAGQRKETGYIVADGEPVQFRDVRVPQGRLHNVGDYHAELNADYDWWESASGAECESWVLDTIAGYPVIRANGQLESKYGRCRLFVGAADDVAFLVTDGDLQAAREGDGGGPRCDRADQAAAFAIETLKDGR
jgi:hypothetical protein